MAVKPFDWTPESIALLGTMCDADVGAEIGLSTSAVCVKRQSLGIPSYKGAQRRTVDPEWGRDMRRVAGLLGTMPDAELAAQVGMSAARIARLRGARHLPQYLSPEEVAKDAERRAALADLGKVPDEQVAAAIGVSRQRIHAIREQLGIPAYRNSIGGYDRTWTVEEVALLGTRPDSALAKQFGCTARVVANKRASLGIAAAEQPPHRGRARSWTDQEVGMLGKISDAKVASLLGVSPATVRRARKDLEIPPSEPPRQLGRPKA